MKDATVIDFIISILEERDYFKEFFVIILNNS